MPLVTRFAPSPTGSLHLGHAFSALFASESARAGGGRFLLRIEDIDPVRCRPEFTEAIFEDLRWLGLTWEEPVLRQSGHMEDYAAALAKLSAMGLLYPCFCTRREIEAEVAASAAAPHLALHGPDGPVYPGTCRARGPDEARGAVEPERGGKLAARRGKGVCDDGAVILERPGRRTHRGGAARFRRRGACPQGCAGQLSSRCRRGRPSAGRHACHARRRSVSRDRHSAAAASSAGLRAAGLSSPRPSDGRRRPALCQAGPGCHPSRLTRGRKNRRRGEGHGRKDRAAEIEQRRNPSPCPSPSGRGNDAATAAPGLPLPWGEGWGEGVLRWPSGGSPPRRRAGPAALVKPPA